MHAFVTDIIKGTTTRQALRDPQPRYGEVLIRVAACGVCHTDLHVMKGHVNFPSPCVLGHEVSGTVEAVGSGVTDLSVGQRVVSSFVMPCGSCQHCVRGQEDLCEIFFALNRVSGVLFDGETRLYQESDDSPVAMYSMAGLAELSVAPRSAVFAIPDQLPLTDSAILGCSILTAVGAVRNVAQVRPGDTVAVIATGGVGLAIIQLAAAFGASTIVGVDISSDKLALAMELGATHTVNSLDPDHVQQIRSITNGKGVDIAFEALGNPTTIGTAMNALSDGGTVVIVGIAPPDVKAEFEITRLVRRKQRILGSFGGRSRTDMPFAIELFRRGVINPAKLITERFAFDDAALAYEKLERGEILGRAIINFP